MAKVKSYMNPNIPKPKPGDSNSETRFKIQPVKPSNPGKPGRPVPKPLPKPGKPGKPGRPTPKPLPKPGIRKKSGDMGSSARNQRFPKQSPSRRGGR